MEKKIKKHNLPFEKTIPYFSSHIKCGNFLSKLVCERINFTKGSFFTILPNNTRSDFLLNFDVGIVAPTFYGDKTYKIQGLAEEFRPTQVSTTERPCSELVFKFLQKNHSNIALIESTILRLEDPYVNIKGVNILSSGSEVCYILNYKNKTSEICDTIRKAGDVWHFLMVLTCFEGGIQNIDEATLATLCANAQFIVAGAYDGEGFIFWQSSEAKEDLI